MSVDQLIEQWRPIPYNGEYEISNTGKVRRKGRIGSTLPVFGSGAGRFVKIKDRKGRVKERNIKSLVEAIFKHPLVVLPPRNDSGTDTYNEPATKVVPGPIEEGSNDVAEEWLPVLVEGVSDDLYEVSNRGRVRKTDGTEISQNGPTPGSAKWVALRGDGRQTKHRVDVLVLEAFGPVSHDPSNVPIHLNGDRTDSHAENLRWGTREEAGRGFARGVKIKQAKTPKAPAPSLTPPGGTLVQVERFARFRTQLVDIIHDGAKLLIKVEGAEPIKISRTHAQELAQVLRAALE